MSWFKNLLNSREKAVSTSVCASGGGEGGGRGGLQLRAPQEAGDQDQDVQHTLHAQVFPLCKVLVPSISRYFKPLVSAQLGREKPRTVLWKMCSRKPKRHLPGATFTPNLNILMKLLSVHEKAGQSEGCGGWGEVLSA